MNQSLKNLAISEAGFLFDPFTGKTFTTNETGIFVIQHLKDNLTSEEIQLKLMEEFDIEKEQMERDLADFLIQLKENGLLQ